MIDPNMGIPKEQRATPASTGLAGALFSTVQQRVLAFLFGQPDRRFQSAELIRLCASGTGAVHRFVTRLADAGLVNVTHGGSQKYYQANQASPIFPELHGLVVKTVGLAGPIQDALAPLAAHIQAAFVYGSVARGTDSAQSDIDLMVIGDAIAYSDLYDALAAAERVLARPINPNVMTAAEWRAKSTTKDSFAARVAAQPRLFVMGSEDAIQ
jgi:predicted nucleotidyltransferase